MYDAAVHSEDEHPKINTASPSVLRQALRLCLTGYAILAAVYTTWDAAALGLLKQSDYVDMSSSPAVAIAERVTRSSALNVVDLVTPATIPNRLASAEWGRIASVKWNKGSLTWRTSNDREGSPTMSEDLFLSKAFGTALQPSKIIPYYYRARTAAEARDITISTIVTGDRFNVLDQLSHRYKGPISVAIHVSSDTAARAATLKSLKDLYETSSSIREYVDIHLVIDNFDRQFNMWRNVARFFARTDYFMMLDVDFAVCSDFRNRVLTSTKVMDKLGNGSAAFVIPAFEYYRQADGRNTSAFPINKASLLKLVDQNKIGMFHRSWEPGHGSTNYSRYYSAPPGEVYKVTAYTAAYEPYVILKKEGPPYCDERFIGYGANKAACLFQIYLSGISFYVLPDDFIIHQSHEYAESVRKNERRYNRKLYLDFREELCFRYLSHFIQTRQMGGPLPRNMLVECRKIRGFSGAAGKIIRAAADSSEGKGK